MITVTLELNRKCNLRCNYCYITDKNNEEMDSSTAYNSIDFAIDKIESQNHKKRKVVISFLGGEPLLSFILIMDIVNYCKVKKKLINIEFQYVLTTNGTIFNEEILAFLSQNNFSLKVSVDGNEEIHNLNRRSVSGDGSFDLIRKNLHFLGEYENITQKFIQVSSVLTKNNYMYYPKTLEFLVEQLGFRYIDFGINSLDEWTHSDILNIKKIMEQALDYYLVCTRNGKEFVWNYLENSLDEYENIQRLYSCGAGVNSYYVAYSGKYFLCPTLFSDEYELGDVNKEGGGITPFFQSFQELINIERIDAQKCHNCKAEITCRVKGCFASSISENGSIHKPSSGSCLKSRLSYDFIKSNFFRIKEVKDISLFQLL